MTEVALQMPQIAALEGDAQMRLLRKLNQVFNVVQVSFVEYYDNISKSRAEIMMFSFTLPCISALSVYLCYCPRSGMFHCRSISHHHTPLIIRETAQFDRPAAGRMADRAAP